MHLRELARSGFLSREVKELTIHQVIGAVTFWRHRWYSWTVDIRVYPLGVCKHFNSVRQDLWDFNLPDVSFQIFWLICLKLSE